MLFEISKSAFRNVGNMEDFREEILAALDQLQRSTSMFGSLLKSFHNIIDQLQKNWSSIQVGGSGSDIGNCSWLVIIQVLSTNYCRYILLL